MLNRKRHDLITASLAEANKRHGYTLLQSLADAANDDTMRQASTAGAAFKYTRTFLINLDRRFMKAFPELSTLGDPTEHTPTRKVTP